MANIFNFIVIHIMLKKLNKPIELTTDVIGRIRVIK